MKFTLINKKPIVPGVISFSFTPEEPLTWSAGQYAHYLLPHDGEDDRGSERWFTISSAPYEKEVVITTRLTEEHGSSFKKTLNNLAIGETIQSDYVDGDFVIEDTEAEYVFIAGGIGITPFHSILKEADHACTKLNVTLLYANRDENIVFKNELDQWAQNNPELSIHYLLDPKRIDENVVREYVPDLQKPIFYLSGPEPMVKSLKDMLEGMGIPESHIKLDDFPGYPTY